MIRENNDLNNQIKDLDKSHKELLANLSHDLRTPLTSLIGYIELFEKDDKNKEEYLGILSRRSKTLKELIEKFYQYAIMSNYESGELENINIVDLTIEIILNYYDLFEQAGQDLEIKKDIEIFETVIDRKLFEILINNAMDNMLKYSKGSNKISILEKNNKFEIVFSNKTDLKDGNYDFLFERMKVIDSTRKNSTGLGLSILKSAADKLSCESSIIVKENTFYLKIKKRK